MFLELCASEACIAEEIELKKMRSQYLIELFFAVFPAEILVHLRESKLGAGGGKEFGEGEDFRGHGGESIPITSEPQMNTDVRRFAEFVWKNIIFICILYANVNICILYANVNITLVDF